jgi:hypothetical protein
MSEAAKKEQSNVIQFKQKPVSAKTVAFTERSDSLDAKRGYCESAEVKRALFPTADAVIYLYDNGDGLPCAVGFTGRKTKASFRYRFEDVRRCVAYTDEWLARCADQVAAKEKRQAEKSAFKTSLTVGAVLYTSWGYEQTNVEFYQVVEVSKSGKSVKIRGIAGDYTPTADMQGDNMPIIDRFIGEILSRRVHGSTGRDAVRINSVCTAWVWDGKPKYSTSYA